jgi:hypothetical protein
MARNAEGTPHSQAGIRLVGQVEICTQNRQSARSLYCPISGHFIALRKETALSGWKAPLQIKLLSGRQFRRNVAAFPVDWHGSCYMLRERG